MDRDTFRNHLVNASEFCREFTARFVLDSLPHDNQFMVWLNCSYDGNPLKDGEVVFPNDRPEYGKRIGPLEAGDVVSLLWRDQMVPEWIDISGCDADEQFTFFELKCCGRFTSEDHLLYYTWTDVAPFGVKGPAFPTRLATAALDGGEIPKFSLAESRRASGATPAARPSSS
jgi:hypothetical protein